MTSLQSCMLLEFASRASFDSSLLFNTLAEETMRAKQMLATMSHEIRSPLSGVVSMAEILSTSKLDKEQRQLLDVMISSGDLVLQLINDILDLSKVESGLRIIFFFSWFYFVMFVYILNLTMPFSYIDPDNLIFLPHYRSNEVRSYEISTKRGSKACTPDCCSISAENFDLGRTCSRGCSC